MKKSENGITTMKYEPLLFKYWGKADKEGYYHLLVYHCLDVAVIKKVRGIVII